MKVIAHTTPSNILVEMSRLEFAAIQGLSTSDDGVRSLFEKKSIPADPIEINNLMQQMQVVKQVPGELLILRETMATMLTSLTNAVAAAKNLPILSIKTTIV